MMIDPTPSLFAAAGKTQIQCPPGLKMAGFGARLEGAQATHDPIMARALRLESAETTIVWIACDLIGVATDVDAVLRRRIGASCGVEPNSVFISCSHTHGSPNSITFRGPIGAPDPPWLANLAEQLTDLAASLAGKIVPATLSIAQARLGGLGYNRQDAHVPIDEMLNVLAIDAADGTRIATMLNYALHPVVLGERNMFYTADYPGCAAAAMEAGAGGVALWVQGACGDVEPIIYRDLGRASGTFALAQQIGEQIAACAVKAMRSARPSTSSSLIAGERSIDLPLDGPPSLGELAELRRGFVEVRGDAPEPLTDEAKWAAFEIAWADDLRGAIVSQSVPAVMRLRLAAARIGDAVFIAVPAEIYAEIGLDLKRALSPTPAFIAAYTGGVIGYIATDDAKRQGGYGPAQSHRVFNELLTAVGYGAGDLVVKEAAALARSLDG